MRIKEPGHLKLFININCCWHYQHPYGQPLRQRTQSRHWQRDAKEWAWFLWGQTRAAVVSASGWGGWLPPSPTLGQSSGAAQPCTKDPYPLPTHNLFQRESLHLNILGTGTKAGRNLPPFPQFHLHLQFNEPKLLGASGSHLLAAIFSQREFLQTVNTLPFHCRVSHC